MATRRGHIAAFDSMTWLATVRLDGSSPQSLTGVRVNRGLDPGEISAGRRCLIDLGDDHDPNDALLVAVYA